MRLQDIIFIAIFGIIIIGLSIYLIYDIFMNYLIVYTIY